MSDVTGFVARRLGSLRKSADGYVRLLLWLVGDILRKHRWKALRIFAWALAGLGLRVLALAIPVAIAHAFANGQPMQVAGVHIHIQIEDASFFLWVGILMLAGATSGWCQVRMVQHAVDASTAWVSGTLADGLVAVSGKRIDLPQELREGGDRAVWRGCIGGVGRLFQAARLILLSFLPLATVLAGFGFMCLISARLTLVVLVLAGLILGFTLVAGRALARKARVKPDTSNAMLRLYRTTLLHRVCVGTGMLQEMGQLRDGIEATLVPNAALQRQREVSRSISDVGLYLGGAALILIVLHGVRVKADWASWSLLLAFLLAMHQSMAALKQVMANLVSINIAYPTLRVFYALSRPEGAVDAWQPVVNFAWAPLPAGGAVAHPGPQRGDAIGVFVMAPGATPLLPEEIVDGMLVRSDGGRLRSIRLASDDELQSYGMAPGTAPARDLVRCDAVLIPAGEGTSIPQPDTDRPLRIIAVSPHTDVDPALPLIAVTSGRRLQAVLTRAEFEARRGEFRPREAGAGPASLDDDID